MTIPKTENEKLHWQFANRRLNHSFLPISGWICASVSLIRPWKIQTARSLRIWRYSERSKLRKQCSFCFGVLFVWKTWINTKHTYYCTNELIQLRASHASFCKITVAVNLWNRHTNENGPCNCQLNGNPKHIHEKKFHEPFANCKQVHTAFGFAQEKTVWCQTTTNDNINTTCSKRKLLSVQCIWWINENYIKFQWRLEAFQHILGYQWNITFVNFWNH